MSHEKIAREIHNTGRSCATSVYEAFRDINKNTSRAPSPRAEGGKCGAVLAAEKVLKETGTGRIEEFDSQFLKKFGSLKCHELLGGRYSCHELVGIAARITDELCSTR